MTDPEQIRPIQNESAFTDRIIEVLDEDRARISGDMLAYYQADSVNGPPPSGYLTTGKMKLACQIVRDQAIESGDTDTQATLEEALTVLDERILAIKALKNTRKYWWQIWKPSRNRSKINYWKKYDDDKLETLLDYQN